MANGRPLTFVNWNAGEPNNFRYENGEEENCLELWNRDDKGLKWNDSPCSFETYFICEVRSDWWTDLGPKIVFWKTVTDLNHAVVLSKEFKQENNYFIENYWTHFLTKKIR